MIVNKVALIVICYIRMNSKTNQTQIMNRSDSDTYTLHQITVTKV